MMDYLYAGFALGVALVFACFVLALLLFGNRKGGHT
jgi:hypothetical protein